MIEIAKTIKRLAENEEDMAALVASEREISIDR
jgi:hypothetical protein